MYLRARFYYAVLTVVLLLAAGEVWSPLFVAGQVALLLLSGLLTADLLLLYSRKHGLQAFRRCADRFSNGDENEVGITVSSSYPFPVRVTVADEIPVEFQLRHLQLRTMLAGKQSVELVYRLRPVRRGAYTFGFIRLFAAGPVGFAERRFTCGSSCTVKVYPSFQQFHTYELAAIGTRLTDPGIKRIRQIGHRTDFEQIREYVAGDNYRAVNWKATARRGQLMVNLYQDERSQSLYCLLDKGRGLQSAFRQMTLFDYAVNASLMLSHIALFKDDQAGLLSFCEKPDTFLPASRRQGHMQRILDTLYNQSADFGESDFASLCLFVGQQISKRSLLVLFTHFSGLNSLNRSLPYLRQLAGRHRLLVVYFSDPELQNLATADPSDEEGYFLQATAEKFLTEEQAIAHRLKTYGIESVYTPPAGLTAAVVNKYLELKVRQVI